MPVRKTTLSLTFFEVYIFRPNIALRGRIRRSKSTNMLTTPMAIANRLKAI